MTSIIAIELNTNPVHANIHHLNQSRKTVLLYNNCSGKN